MAVNGRGFFQVQLPDGTAAYTRDGSFQINAEGQMVNANGYLLQPEITLPTNAQTVTIGSDGTVSAQIANQPTASQVGTIQLTDFVNPAGLQAVGGNLFLESPASGSPQTGTAGANGMGLLVQGSLETSNVNVVEEMVDMIETQRTYEMNSKAISSTDQMLQYVNNNL